MDAIIQSKRKEKQSNDQQDTKHRIEISRFLEDPGNSEYQDLRLALAELLETRFNPASSKDK